MDRLGFIDFNTRLSPENSGKAASYATAIQILDEVLKHQNVIKIHGRSLYDIKDVVVIQEVLELVKVEVGKMRKSQPNIFDYGKPNQRSYPLNNFCSAALNSLITYAQYEQDVELADRIVAEEKNPNTISEKLLTHFDLTKEGEDVVSQTKRRKGQDYFRRMILANYGGRCALTGIDIPQLLIASHIIPWEDKSHKKERLNPCNGICLSALYDKAFDKGLIGFNPQLCTVLSIRIKEKADKDFYDKYFAPIDGRKLTVPTRYTPNLSFLEWHMNNIFKK